MGILSLRHPKLSRSLHVSRHSLKAVTLLLAFPWFGQSFVFAQRPSKPETSSDKSFHPDDIEKLAVIVEGNARTTNLGSSGKTQTDEQRAVEDAFVQVLMKKGYSICSRSDVQNIVKEQKFQSSGLTEGDAAKLGKILNVPAVMIVKVTEHSEEKQYDKKAKKNFTTAKAAIGARLVGVESGSVLWIGKFDKEGRGEVSKAVAEVSKAIADSFPNRKPAKKSADLSKDRESGNDPKNSPK